MDDVGADVIEETLVMGHHQQRLLPGLQVAGWETWDGDISGGDIEGTWGQPPTPQGNHISEKNLAGHPALGTRSCLGDSSDHAGQTPSGDTPTLGTPPPWGHPITVSPHLGDIPTLGTTHFNDIPPLGPPPLRVPSPPHPWEPLLVPCPPSLSPGPYLLSQMTALRSRWLVGSSNINNVGSINKALR